MQKIVALIESRCRGRALNALASLNELCRASPLHNYKKNPLKLFNV